MPPRKVVVRQEDGRGKRSTFATAVMTSPAGHQYFLFGTDRKEAALRLSEREALKVLDSWREAEKAGAGRCIIEPAS